MKNEKIWIESWKYPGQETVAVRQLRDLAGSARLASSPESATLVLFVESEDISPGAVHPLYRRFPERCYGYSAQIAPYGLLPGSYTGMSKWRNLLGRYVNYGYVGQETVKERVSEASLDLEAPRRYLFSFMGGSTAWVRKRLYKQAFTRADVHIEDTSSFHNWSRSQKENEAGRIRYYQTILESKFVLCPRGAAPSSIRLYEVMELGRVPVVLADAWIANPLVDWESFAVFVREKDLDTLEARLTALEERAEEMGCRARAAWEAHFAPERQFEELVRCLSLISLQRKLSERWVRPFWGLMRGGVRLALATRQYLRCGVLAVFRLLRIRFPYRLNRDH